MFYLLLLWLLDWVFNIPDLYQDCNLSPSECEADGAQVQFSFDHSVNAPNQITVKCTEGKRSDGLPDWVWNAEGFEFSKFVPSCVDPTYCETDPPVPGYPNADYKIPDPGTLKYADGEFVTYTCQNPSKYQMQRSVQQSSTNGVMSPLINFCSGLMSVTLFIIIFVPHGSKSFT